MNLRLFVGQNYLDDLKNQYPYIPEKPSHLDFGMACQMSSVGDNVHRNDAANSSWLPLPPTFCALPYQDNNADAHFVPAPPIFHNQLSNAWLVLGKVYTLSDGGRYIYDERSMNSNLNQVDDDWIG